jgi:uncharacterized protein
MVDYGDFIAKAWEAVTALYAKQVREIPFHGLHHVNFVVANAKKFAHELDADAAKVEIAALVHDVNYLVAARSGVAAGQQLRYEILRQAGLDDDSAAEIEEIVATAETNVRDRYISAEAMALSDADTLFKALPITPVVLAPLYMRETGISVRDLAEKIVDEQVPLRDDGIYFYSASAKRKYARWGNVNLTLWSCIRESLDDPSVADVIEQVSKYTKIPLETPYGDGREPEASYSAAEPAGGTIA